MERTGEKVKNKMHVLGLTKKKILTLVFSASLRLSVKSFWS